MRPPGIRFADLPPIDVVLLSHNHYDHLDLDTIKNLHNKFHPNIFTALGVSSFLEKHGIGKSVDMDWWDEQPLGKDLKIVALPAQHFSGRGTFDRDATLWCGFGIKRRQENIYFAADTGYNETSFKEIGRRLSPIRVSILPIGAYKPRWFMSPIHVSPDEAVKIHLDVRSKTSIGSHFGTFPLADEGREDPAIDLKKAMKEMNIPEEEFIVMQEGSWREF
jgi:L-ascorbate metabolism protein UlaG (beta-lactamase superfamily)